ncbi:CUB domain-containing protein 1 [Thalassophryne amazonica]|uniref:CUB domain-containing protein 1 n=1 Tax=Thalassophryne amazonica TaxID=390379 RepID=UPI0014726A7C|nr:CUB domain-containing protein 1 [Thalassophryne amazonica]
MQLCGSSALLGLLFLTIFDSSECLQMKVHPDKGLVIVSTELPLDQCAVCTVDGVNVTQCSSRLVLQPEQEVTLLFNCSQSIDQAYNVQIVRDIECTMDACSLTTGETQPSILSEFPRTFTWNLKTPENTVVGLNIVNEGLVETSQPCDDGLQYSVTTKNVQTHYCRGGSVKHLELPNEAIFSLQVKPKSQVESLLFQTSAAPIKGRKVDITVDPDVIVDIRREPEGPECHVCLADRAEPTCDETAISIADVQNTLEFTCLEPQDVFTVTMKKKIVCTRTSCSSATGHVHPTLLKEFQRAIMWDIVVPERTELTLGFPGDGLTETSGPEKCDNRIQYTVKTTKADGKSKIKNYCQAGPVSHLDLLGTTTVTVDIPKGGELGPTAFTVKVVQRAGRMIAVTPDLDTTISIIKRINEPDCTVCIDKGPSQKCNPRHLILTDARNTSVDFSCPQPQEVFSVEINKKIECTETTCSVNTIQAETSMFPDFNQTFIWDLKVPPTKAFQLDFSKPGIRQIPNGDSCPDDHTYSLVTYLRTGPATVGTFCKGGTVDTILVRYKGRLLLQVPGQKILDPLDIKLSVGPVMSMVAIVKAELPRGVSQTEFTTASYPADFPDDEQMQWDFVVPGMHNYTVHFRDQTMPECLQKDVVVEYEKEDKKVTKLSLMDPQPEHQQGNFNMHLKNCKTNRTLEGLTLKFAVSVMRSGHPVLCTVDLTKYKDVSLQIEKVGSDPYCEMRIDSKLENKINVAAGNKAGLSFLDCPNEDVRLTASKVIGCQNIKTCFGSGTLLTVPKLDLCLPIPLHSFSWHLTIPEGGTVDLVSPTGTLQQSLPGQECNNSFSLHVADGGGSSVGDFCFNGIIEKVQVHSNVTVTARAKNFTETRGPFLNVSFSQEISESIIYRVKPKVSSPALLATPNWPDGMKAFSTVSWLVTLPSQYEADMTFVNVSQPKCSQPHTIMKVQTLGSEEEMLSRREDEDVVDKLLVPDSFYLNVSNCNPEEGHFGVLTKVILQKKSSHLLAILLGIAGALLLLTIILAVVCVIIRKKKKEQNKGASLYVGKVNIFMPSDKPFSKSRSDNESHVYASIDETRVYGHLLGDSSYADSMQDHFQETQVDSYNTFKGPNDTKLPVINEPDAEPEMDQIFLDPSESFIPSRPRTPIGRQDSIGFEDRRMVQNALYTFKNTGDINTIRLSDGEMESNQ